MSCLLNDFLLEIKAQLFEETVAHYTGIFRGRLVPNVVRRTRAALRTPDLASCLRKLA